MTHAGRVRAVAFAAVLALAAAPLAAQPADTAASCVRAPGPAESAELVRWACAGTDFDAAVRFSVSLPAAWEVASPGDAGLVIWAERGGVRISVAAQDQLHAPVTRSDTLGFWMRATGIYLNREPTLEDVGAFRRATRSPDKARRAVTRAQQRDAVLLAMARGLSAAHEGQTVLASAAEVRPLAGAPAGWLSETVQENGVTRRWISCVTVRDAVVLIATLRAAEDEYEAALPAWEQALATLEMRTERGGTVRRAAIMARAVHPARANEFAATTTQSPPAWTRRPGGVQLPRHLRVRNRRARPAHNRSKRDRILPSP